MTREEEEAEVRAVCEVEQYADEVHGRALSGSGDAVRADIARREALAQATGLYGPEGFAVFDRWRRARST